MFKICKRLLQRITNARNRSLKDDFAFLWQAILYMLIFIPITGCMIETPMTASIPVPTKTDTVPSATFVYPTIPPTATRIPGASPTPTPDILIGLGDVLFEDDFSTDQGWDLSGQEYGAISLSNNRLVIALRKSQSFLISQAPDLSLSDFYLEVDVRADICQPGDEFGVIFRMNDALEHYRFSLNCEGESRIARTLSGESRSLTPPTTYPFIRSGAMSSNRLSLKATGDTFQFWINAFEVFSIRDISLAEGSIGLFARSGQGNQATISFNNFILRELLPSQTFDVTATP
jgi:hypothetical protein